MAPEGLLSAPSPDRKGRILRWLSFALLLANGALTAYLTLGPPLGLPRLPGELTSLLTTLAFAFALTHALATEGANRALLLLGLTALVSVAFESAGVATGWVYGPYHYSDRLGPKLFGLVPTLIPIAWFMMSYPAALIAEDLVGRLRPQARPRWLVLAFSSAAVMTAWDLVMDPMMVRLGFWVWERRGLYFGIPLQNYLGWMATAFTYFALYRWLIPRLPGAVPIVGVGFRRLAAWSYLIVVAGNVSAALHFNLLGPALIGLFVGGGAAVAGLLAAGADQADGVRRAVGS